MKHLKLFETHKNTSKVDELLDGISPEFWEMVNTAKWWLVIKASWKILMVSKKQAMKECKGRIYTNYEYSQIKKFDYEMNTLYKRLKNYFEPYWLGKIKMRGYSGYNVSDDGYWDLLSSVKGKGKLWTIDCIEHPSIPAQMAKTNDYTENFSYLLSGISYDEYHEIRCEFDPFYRETSRYNL